MSLNESHVEDAALEWFGELGYAVAHGPHLAPGEPAAEQDSFGDVVLVGRLRDAIWRLNPAIPDEAEVLSNVVDEAVNQAATWVRIWPSWNLVSLATSMSSSAPSRVRQCLAADSASLKSMVNVACLVPLPLVRR